MPAKGPAGAWGSRVVYPATSPCHAATSTFFIPFTLFLKIAFELGERLIPALGANPW